MIAMTTPKTIAAMRNIMGAQMPYRTVLANFMVAMTNADDADSLMVSAVYAARGREQK